MASWARAWAPVSEMAGWFTREVSIGGEGATTVWAPGQGLFNGQAVEEAPSKQEVTKSWTSRKTATVSLIAACVLVAMVTSMGFTVATIFVLLETGYMTVTPPAQAEAFTRVCVPCDALRITSDPLDDLSSGFDKEDNDTICCTSNSTELQIIISTIALREINKAKAEAPPPCSSCNYRYPLGPNITAMPSLGKDYVMHLIMGGVPTGRHTGFQTVRNWNGRGSVVRKGMGLDTARGRFKVKRAGLYYINSRIMFATPATNKPGKEYTFTQRLVRQDPRTLVTSVIIRDTVTTTCGSWSMRNVCHASMMTTLRYLRRGEEMYIEVNHAQSIENTREDVCQLNMFSID